MVEPLQAIVWQLPNGAAMMAANFYAHRLNQEVGQWAASRNINPNLLKWTNIGWYRGYKAPHRMLTMPKEHATMFLLSWTGKPPTYIDEYVHPDEQ